MSDSGAGAERSRAELEPCPFCGKTEPVEVKHRETEVFAFENYDVVCDSLNGGCGASSGYRRTEEDAIAAWNTRAERTCRWAYEELSCSYGTECGGRLTWEPYGAPEFCPRCGAKVVPC